MFKKKYYAYILISAWMVSCYPIKQTQTAPHIITSEKVLTTPNSQVAGEAKTGIFFTDIFKEYPSLFDSIIHQAKERNIQIIYTSIDRGANNLPRLKDYYFNVDTGRYFYPASTVKLPTALLALQRLNELKGTGININTTMITEAAYSGQTAVYNDPNTPDGKPGIRQYIKKIFLVSDNDAFNRLYEFLGQHYINEELNKKGYTNAQVLHRLDIFLSEDENRHTNPVKFLADDNTVLYQQGLLYNQSNHIARNDFLGKAFYKNDTLINRPMDFSKKNRITLPDLHSMLRSIIFPASVTASRRFNLTADNYKFIYKCMSAFPGESVYPAYDTINYPDSYIKFLKNGREERSLPKNIRIFNKSGEAYGQLTDIAYIVDLDKNIEFFLSATINCTVDRIVNNDKYDYETAGYPFLANLGKVIYDYELHRKRSHTPDLSQFKIVYDK